MIVRIWLYKLKKKLFYIQTLLFFWDWIFWFFNGNRYSFFVNVYRDLVVRCMVGQ